jgi:predicted phage-related endonuclease
VVDDKEFEGYVPNETPMDRGTRLQKYAIDRFTKETGKKIDETLLMWISEENESIAISPDGTVIGEKSAIETKCLSSARHIEAYLTNSIPDDYEYQKLQYFITNGELETLYFAFYDPRLPAKDFFYFEIKRSDIQEDIDYYLDYQKKVLKDVDEVVAQLTGF